MSTFLLEPVAHRNEQLETLLQRRLGNRVRDLRVLTFARGILLQGRTDTYHAKQLAEDAALELADIPQIANDIEIA